MHVNHIQQGLEGYLKGNENEETIGFVCSSVCETMQLPKILEYEILKRHKSQRNHILQI